MKNIPPCFFSLFLITNLICLHLSSAYDVLYKVCGSTSNYAGNSTYSFNLDKLFSSLSTEAVAKQGFYENTIGTAPDQISGLVLCRGDVDSSICRDCLNQSFNDLSNQCPSSNEATVYYDFCLLSYSNQQFLNSTDNSQQVYSWNLQNVTDSRVSSSNNAKKKYFDNEVNTLLSSVSNQAAYNSEKGFATGVIYITSSLPMIYGLSQCTPDFPNNTCHACLQDLLDQMPKRFNGRKGGRILAVRCNLRYEKFPFFGGKPNLQIGSISGASVIPIGDQPTQPPPPMNSPSSTSKGGKSWQLTTIISESVILLIIVFFIAFLLIRKLRCAETEVSQEEKVLVTNKETTLDPWSRERSAEFPLFNFNQIANATGNFSLDNKLGEGGFGPVYKGVLQDGLEIAVKRLSTYSGQGLVEFKNEIQLIAKLQHRNLVRLVGWCIEREEKILIYEFMPSKSLDYFISDKKRGAFLNWEKRFEIIEGIAQGLLYLHKHSRLRVVHRDLKASNILLDSEMNPKISDFGLARIFGPKELQANTNRVVGTYGYMAPEYASEGLFSSKSDVFSFGVLVLEIVSGKRNMDFHQYRDDFRNLLGYAWVRWKDGSFLDLICPTLTLVPQRQTKRCIHVALLCVQENPVDRPIMSDVIVFLTTETIILPEPKQPAYFNVRVTEGVGVGACSINYVTLTNPEVR
ncbi:cysteine-rich receptor-like protein kinase 15 [Carex rostrata]